MSDIPSDDAPPNEEPEENTKTDNEKDSAQEEPEELTADEVIDAEIKESKFGEQKKLNKKKKIKYGAIAGVVLLLGLFLKWAFTPYTGSMAYGICKVFLELTVRYPTTLKISTVEEYGTYVRIWYAQTDSFGEYRVQPIQCNFKQDETYGFILDKVTIRRREVDTKIINDFNKSLRVIFTHQPDLTLPNPLPDSLKNLQIDTQLFRKPIL